VERGRPAGSGPALVALTLLSIRDAGWPERAVALLLGLAAFLLVVGPAPLDPTNIGWLAEADAATNYLGWAFYRASPWTWPPAANPAYGMDIAGSVMMADANPLMAFPFKLLSPLLPTPFQYFGWWLLLCFLLQAWFAHAIARRITAFPEQRLAITSLLLFAPFFLIRIATPAVFHMTLCGQWQILAAMWLYLSPGLARRTLAWSLLLVAAVLTHPYLLALVAAIWLADLLRALIGGEAPLPRILIGGAIALVSAAVVAKLSGVFWLEGAGHPSSATTMSVEWGFGIYKANLLTAIDPDGWSRVLPDIDTEPERIEGFAYLGLGVLLLAPLALGCWNRLRPQWRFAPKHLPLILVLLGSALFSLSASVELGRHVLNLPWPSPLLVLGNLFRSTDRFVWPIAYAAMFLIAWGVARGWRRPVASLLLVAAAAVQIVDTSAGWRAYAATFARTGSSWPTSLQDPFWKKAAGRYRAVRLVVPRNRVSFYRDINAWALANGLRSDVIYLARYDRGALDRMATLRAEQVRRGSLPRDTLWIVDGVPADRLAAMPRRAGDFIGTVDAIPLFAPDFERPAGAH